MIRDKPYIRFILFILFIILLVALSQFFSFDYTAIDNFIKQLSPIWAAIIFILFYIIGTFFIWYLKDPLKIVGAICFGAYLSTLFIYLAEIINAYIFFKISKIGGKDFIAKKAKGKSKKIYEKIGKMNLGWIFLLRAIPLIPYRVLDLGFGLSKISFRRYLLVVVLASLPRIFWIQFILASVKDFSWQNLTIYFSKNTMIFWASVVYLLLTIVGAVILKKKTKIIE
ncbi:MAG: VTT domain-containing protein [Candidatus Omnitrophica bacterium]|nr:VTT domain-containing protein [Candidatus Omnitrophota bacterium]